MSQKDQEPTENSIDYLEMNARFRQLYQLGTALFEVKKALGHNPDRDTGRILLSTDSSKEGQPRLPLSITEDDIAQYQLEQVEWDQRTTEIINETETWLRVLPDDGLEVTFEQKRYDQGYINSGISVDDFARAREELLQRRIENMEEARENPLLSFAAEVANSPHRTLQRSKKTLIFRPSVKSGTLDIDMWSEQYDPDGNPIASEREESVNLRVGNENADFQILNIRSIFLSEMKTLLDLAKKNTDYEGTFLQKFRNRLMNMIILESKLAFERGKKMDTLIFYQEEMRLKRFRNGSHQYLYRTLLSRRVTNGVVSMENILLIEDIPNPSTPENKLIFLINPTTTELIEVEEKLQQLGRKKLMLRNQNVDVYGHIRHMTVDLRTGKYSYQFIEKKQALTSDNPSDKDIFIEITGDPDTLSFDELLDLLSLLN